MKKSLLAAAVLLSGTALLVSCKKEVEAPRGKDQQAVRSTARMSGANFAFNDAGECMNDGAECHSVPPIIIRKECFALIAQAASGGKVEVGNVFSSEMLNDVCVAMSADLVHILQSGDFYIRKNYESNQVVNYLVGTTYPVTAENRTTVFQLHK